MLQLNAKRGIHSYEKVNCKIKQQEFFAVSDFINSDTEVI